MKVNVKHMRRLTMFHLINKKAGGSVVHRGVQSEELHEYMSYKQEHMKKNMNKLHHRIQV